MPPKKLESNRSEDSSAFKSSGSEPQPESQSDFESERAITVMSDLYPELLEACTDEDDEIDTRAVFESLAGMTGLFFADYQEFYGHEKAMEAFREFVDLSLLMYSDRVDAEADTDEA
jgi:hypothetical protein